MAIGNIIIPSKGSITASTFAIAVTGVIVSSVVVNAIDAHHSASPKVCSSSFVGISHSKNISAEMYVNDMIDKI